jgi:replicative DNA helicase
MAVGILHQAWTNRNFEILVIAPYQPQVKKLFEMMRLFISTSVSLNGSVKINRESPYEQITFNNGSTIRGFSSGARTGAKSDKIRGQDANLIIMDEVDYLADADLEVISAILASNPDTGLVVASTPTGIRQKLHRWCTNKEERFKEFWFISSESPSWGKKAEDYFKSNYSEGGYSREFLAEFGTEMVGVFRSSDIDNSIRPYGYKDCFYDPNRRYIIGVDWNKNTGTHIIVVEQRWDAETGAKYRPVEKIVIRKAEFTQLAAVQKIMELDKRWQVSFIYVDAGYGAVQVEMLHKFDKDNPHLHTRYRKKVVAVEMGGNTLILDPTTNQDIKKPTKPFFVNMLAKQLEESRVELPREEDTDARIIPEELDVVDIGLVQQMREFKVTKYSPQGRPTYSQDFEHTLTAFMCAIGGFLLNFSDLREIRYRHDVRAVTGIGGDRKTPEEMRQRKSDEKFRRERLAPQSRADKMDGPRVNIEPGESRELPEKGYVKIGTDEKPNPGLGMSPEEVEDEINLLNTGKPSIRMVKARRRRYATRYRPGHRRTMF